MSYNKFLKHEACPSCGSIDNLGVWADGHKFCFGCKYYESGTTNVHQIFSPQITFKNVQQYPLDCIDNVPTKPSLWLLSCDITHQTQVQFGIQWSPSRQMLCWKIGTLGWQGRCFAPDAKTRYISYGEIRKEPTILGYTHGENAVVLVEDYISAIRVSELLPCTPLFGCTISLESLQTLSKRFSTVIVWLDADKLDNARKIAQNASLVGLQSHVLYTPKDPKNYSALEIKQFLETFK